jgi:hypothetical protein
MYAVSNLQPFGTKSSIKETYLTMKIKVKEANLNGDLISEVLRISGWHGLLLTWIRITA